MKITITPVNDNEEKARTYRELMTRFNKAVKEEFYFEALLIDYAMMEDRTLSFLYHCGIQNSRSKQKISKKGRDFLREILPGKNQYSIMNLGNKLEIISAIMTWECELEYTPVDRYRKALKYQCESLDIQLLQKTISQIENWKEYRNEVIHAALNKNLECMWKNMAERVDEGMRLARCIDSQVKIIKKGNHVRKAANLPIT